MDVVHVKPLPHSSATVAIETILDEIKLDEALEVGVYFRYPIPDDAYAATAIDPGKRFITIAIYWLEEKERTTENSGDESQPSSRFRP